MNILQVLKARHVKRFHTTPIIGEQAIDAHSWGVVAIAMHLCQGRPTQHVLDAVMLAMFHDIGESVAGDMPGNVKWSDAGLSKAMDRIESSFIKAVVGTMPDDDFSMWVVKAADILDAMYTLMVQRNLGNVGISVIYDRYESAMKRHLGYDEEARDYDNGDWQFHQQAAYDLMKQINREYVS